MKSSIHHKRRRNLLYAFMALAMGSPAAHADVFDDAWSCAVAVKEGVVDTAIIGGKALKFIATKPDCVTRLGSPATAAPIGVVVGLSNAGVLPKSQPGCSGKIYGVAAKPVAEALDASLGQLGVLPDAAKEQLLGIASGGIAGEALAEIPGMDFVSGSLTCGCDLVDAGLSTETIEKVLNTADNIGDKCGGPVWDKAKEIAGDVADFAGDAVGAGVTAVSNLGDALAGQTKHMPYVNYYEQNWAPNVEAYAAYEFNHPDSWHGGKKWKELWAPCVAYFDGHTQSEDTAQYTCDNMRSGGPLFPKTYFGHSLFQRVFDYEATVLVNQAREQAYADFAELKTGEKIPDFMEDDSDCYAAASIKLHPLLPGMRKAAIDEIFGVPTKEKTHNGIVVRADTPPAKWPAGTVGAHALAYFDKVDAGQFHADAGKAVQMALDDFDIQEKIRARLAEKIAKFYEANRCTRVDGIDKDQQQVNSLVNTCPTKACKQQIADDYQACRADVADWHDDNAALIGDFDNPAGQIAMNEWRARLKQCLDSAKKTFRDNQFSLGGSPVRNVPVDMDSRVDKERLESRVPVTTESKRRTTTADTTSETRRAAREPLREREPLGELDDRVIEKRDQQGDSRHRSTETNDRRSSREPVREREPVSRDDDRVPRTDTTSESRRLKLEEEQRRRSRDALPEPDPVQRDDERGTVTDAAAELQRRREARDTRTSRDPVPERSDAATNDAAAAEVRRREAMRVREARAQGEQRTGGSSDAAVTGADLPGCAAVRGAMNPRVYACTNPTAYQNCLVVVQRDGNIRCTMPKD